MAEPTPLYLLADAIIDGGITKYVEEKRAAGLSWRRISIDLMKATDGKIDVGPTTVRSWFRQETAA